MAAPVGNQFWKFRSKHGRDEIFADANLLKQECYAFFKWCDAHPWYKVEQMKKPITIEKNGKKKTQTLTKVPTARPYTLSALCIYLGVSRHYWNELRKRKSFKDDFMEVITHVEEIIWTQKFEGAAVGAFNNNIIARDLGLAERSELSGPGGGPIKTHNTSEIDVSQLPTEALLAIMNARKKKDE